MMRTMATRIMTKATVMIVMVMTSTIIDDLYNNNIITRACVRAACVCVCVCAACVRRACVCVYNHWRPTLYNISL